ncbi:hypothetical protein B9Z55_026303 [Caenorhabditis nigoni]|uniref:Uncharacterized protein n=1 Tax=Caenorhabditis nigoni TaxID=1611254 RepID=A0A2G5T2K4_9PELO|nr:hypothetical protein B9Z55_026303 [Caenorhabditis nigoni]
MPYRSKWPNRKSKRKNSVESYLNVDEDCISVYNGPEYQVLTNETSSESSNYTESMTDESNNSSPSSSEKKMRNFFQSITKVFKKKNKATVKTEIEGNMNHNQSNVQKKISVGEQASSGLNTMYEFEAVINEVKLINASGSTAGSFSDPFNNDYQIGQSSSSSTNIRFQDQWEQIVSFREKSIELA